MPPERAASVLGAFLGIPNLQPGDPTNALASKLDRPALTALLRATTPWPLGDAPIPDPNDQAAMRLNRQRIGRPALGTKEAELEAALFSFADDLTSKVFGDAVYHRGIVEFSNVCANDCGYCGVRKHAPVDEVTGKPLMRYTMPEDEVVEVARWAHGHGIGTLMIQGGELQGEKRLSYLERVVARVRRDTVAMDAEKQGMVIASTSGAAASAAAGDGAAAAADVDKLLNQLTEEQKQRMGLRVALSVGELTEGEYKRLFAAGARRYLLRIETSSPDLYSLLHPPDMSWQKRVACLDAARAAGFQVGTGVMVGLPGQRLDDLAGDVLFFRDKGANMIGMGPYITEAGTPVADLWDKVYGLGGLAYEVGADEAARRARGPAIGGGGEGKEGLWCGATADAERAARSKRAGAAAQAAAAAAPPPPPPSSDHHDHDHHDHHGSITQQQPHLTPAQEHKKRHMRAMFELTTRVNALARLVNRGANITATTALQAIDPNGREVALRRGANVLMPILTPTKYRQHYQLYEGKPCVTDTADECRRCLNARVGMIGRRLKLGEYGDPPNFAEQQQQRLKGGMGVGMARSYSSASAAAAVPRPAPSSSSALGSECSSCGGSSSSPSPSSSPSSSPSPEPPGPMAGSDVQRVNVGVFGSMNAGKSTLMNAITRQETSIVDATPGTTADVKATLLELHGLGPAKLLDTAGLDESGELGEKKRRKAWGAIKECDVAVVVVDVAKHAALALQGGEEGGAATTMGAGAPSSSSSSSSPLQTALRWERLALERAAQAGAVPFLLLNLRGAGSAASPSNPDLSHPLFRAAAAVRGALDPSSQALSLALDLHGATGATGSRVARDVADAVSAAIREAAARSAARPGVKALPEWVLSSAASERENAEAAAAARERRRGGRQAASLSSSSSSSSAASSPSSPLLQPALKPGYVFMVIPMDAETPSARLLRPQALVQEESIRHWATTTAFRLDLGAARGLKGGDAKESERRRFLAALRPALEHDGPKLLVTDSQAIDVVHPWTMEEEDERGGGGGFAAAALSSGRSGVPAEALGSSSSPSSNSTSRPLLPITTFSIAMINRISGGRLPLFVDGLRAFANLKKGDRVLVAEACNHSRITAACADIGLVQIPQRLRERAGGEVEVEHAFGREFPELMGGDGGGGGEASSAPPRPPRFALAAHCGGCMIDAQKMRARLSDAEEAGVPVTNYGLLLAYVAAPQALERCLAPWGVSAVSEGGGALA